MELLIWHARAQPDYAQIAKIQASMLKNVDDLEKVYDALLYG